jgi:hypothetical protein
MLEIYKNNPEEVLWFFQLKVKFLFIPIALRN